MSRTAGSKNKPKPVTEGAFVYTLEQRMRIIADLVVERILEDQDVGAKIATILNIGADDATKQ